MLNRFWVYIFILGSLCSCEKYVIEYVNPFIGTENSDRPSIWEANGGAYPGAVLPFGMVQATPEDYHYNTHFIRSFSLLEHTTGYPKGSSGIFQIMPFVGEFESINNTGSAFSHENESAKPGYYSVFLDDYNVKAELTATERCVLMKFNFEGERKAGILIHQVSDVTSDQKGRLSGKCRNYYFVLELNEQHAEVEIDDQKILIRFDESMDEETMLKAGFSFNGIEKAEENLRVEIPDWDFKRIQAAAGKEWQHLLSKVRVEGGSEIQKEIFYTALYHTYLAPQIVSDTGEPKRFAGLSPWDTYKTKQPLLTLLNPEIQADMVSSVLDQFNKRGLMDPGPMTGVHNVPILLDSYVKGIDMDPEIAYRAMKASLMRPPYGRRDIASFYDGEYVPAEKSYAVTKTLEYSFNFWAMAQMARELGQKEDQKVLHEKSRYFKNIYNPETKFMTARTANGNWEKGGYREGDKWSYNWTPVHDVQGLINLAGGRDEFVKQLDSCFMSGEYFHDNEPPLHLPYLYTYAGEPWKTEERVRKIMEMDYGNQPGGLSGNDDLGALSAWYVFSAMGIFPACPGRPEYLLGTPLFAKVTISMAEGKKLIIKANNVSRKNKYVQSVSLNGNMMQELWLSHSDVASGGILEFEMGTQAKIREVTRENLPLSETRNKPVISLQNWELSKSKVGADEPLDIIVKLKNTEECEGSFPVHIFVDDELNNTKWFLVEGGETLTKTIEMRWYDPGTFKIAINEEEPKQVEVMADREATFVYGDIVLPSPAVVKAGSEVVFSSLIKNKGSYPGSGSVGFYLNDQEEGQVQLVLKPGEQKEVAFSRAFQNTGLYRIKLGNTEEKKLLVVGSGFSEKALYNKRLKPLMAFNFNVPEVKYIEDFSPLKNNAVVHGDVEWVDGLFGTAIKTNAYKEAYIEIPDHVDYEKIADGKIMSILLWIYPMDETNFADIISKGDLNVIQVRASNTEVNYYSGGYQRGEAYTLLPRDWNRKWHHLAGVSDGKTLKLYIDGKLMVTKVLEEAINYTGTTHLPWNIGRNAANPDRVFDGCIDQLMIFDKALSDDEIIEFMLCEKDE